MKKTLILLILCMCLSLTSCNLPGLSASVDDDIIVASGIFTERQILSEVVSQMIEHYTDLNVTQVKNLGSSTMIHIALERGSLNVGGTMYTGTSLTGELNMEPETDPDKALRLVQEGYLENFDRIWFPSYGFDNTYAFMVREDFANEHNLTKVSDLENLKDTVNVGVDSGWVDRPGDGYGAFQEIYGFSFDNFYTMDIGLVYSAVASGNMDVVLGYSTDGRINSHNLVLLEDDLKLFPAYDCSPVANADILRKYPQLIEIFLKLEGSISSETMQELNKLSSEDRIEPHVLASDFLEENNYFEDVSVDQETLEQIRSAVNVK